MALKVSYIEKLNYSQADLSQRFTGTHPAAMQPRINAQNWRFEHDMSRNRNRFLNRFKLILK